MSAYYMQASGNRKNFFVLGHGLNPTVRLVHTKTSQPATGWAGAGHVARRGSGNGNRGVALAVAIGTYGDVPARFALVAVHGDTFGVAAYRAFADRAVKSGNRVVHAVSP
jgi:hypothetical protein